jgi:hypothetical protein
MQKKLKKIENFNFLSRSFAGKVIGLAIAMILICTAFSAANVLNQESITTLKEQGRSITWDVTMNFINAGGQNDYITFGEAPDALDGPPADAYDVVKPPAPQTPYIRVWLNDNLPSPFDQLWKDYRHYPGTTKVWNLTVQWMPKTGASPSIITMSWNLSEFIGCEYNSVNLSTNMGIVLQNMLVNNTYTFSCPAYVPQDFKIICSYSEPPPELDFGDAPEGGIAYPSTSVIGGFPTCKTCGPSGWIQHNNFGAWFGPMIRMNVTLMGMPV